MEILAFIVVLISVGYVVGSYQEKKHLLSLDERERKLTKLIVITTKKIDNTEKEVTDSKLVAGSVVIAQDYFKMFFANLKNLFGGRISTYESLLERGRREAVLRMKEQCADYNLILNCRFETSTIGVSRGKQSAGCIEVIAYGTAVKFINYGL